MPNTPVSQEIGWYLSGYTDGEGSFCVSFSPRSKMRIKLEVRPSFSVGQNIARPEVLEIFKDTFGCGSIRPNRNDRTLKYEIRCLQELIGKIIPFFEEFSLKSSKNQDFRLFSQVCRLMADGEQLSGSGLKRIIGLAYQMNPSGKRKYSKEYLLEILR